MKLALAAWKAAYAVGRAEGMEEAAKIVRKSANQWARLPRTVVSRPVTAALKNAAAAIREAAKEKP